MKKFLFALMVAGSANGVYAADFNGLAATAAQIKADAAAVPAPRPPLKPQAPEISELERVKTILSFGGGIPAEDAAFMNEWFPRFFAEGSVGRDPNGFERAMVPRWFPKLAEKNDWRVTGEACGRYNCISWSVGVTSSWKWPGDNMSVFDRFYLEYGYIPLAAGETVDRAEIAYWESANGKSKTGKAEMVGALLAKRATGAGISLVAFDRGGYKYHGRIKALAEAAREGGLKF